MKTSFGSKHGQVTKGELETSRGKYVKLLIKLRGILKYCSLVNALPGEGKLHARARETPWHQVATVAPHFSLFPDMQAT